MRPFAGAPVAGGGEEEEEPARSSPRREVAAFPEPGEEALEGRDVVGPAVVPVGEEGAEGAIGAKSRADGAEEGAKGSEIDPPVDEYVEPRGFPGVPGEGGGGGGTEGAEEALERGPDRGDPAEGERGGEEGDDLPIGRGRVAVRELEGVGVEPAAAPLLLEEAQPPSEEAEIRLASLATHHRDAIRPGSLSDPPPEVGW